MEIDGLIYEIQSFKDGYQAILKENRNYTALTVTIPDSIPYEGKQIPVRRIGKQCFATQKIKSVIIGHNVVLIDEECFKDCDSLETVTFRYIEKTKDDKKMHSNNYIASPAPASFDLDYMIAKASEGDYLNPFTSVSEYPESLRTIFNKAFYGCKSLKEVILPKEVYSIYDSCFEYCESLKKVVLPPKMYSIGKNAFACCKSLQEIEIPEKISELKPYTFYFCTSLKNVKLNNDLKALSSDVFYKCEALESIKLPEDIYILRDSCFSYCKSLKEIVLPFSLRSLGYHAFYGCDSLTKVKISNPKMEYHMDCFSECKSLTEIIFPSSEIKINDICVDGCPNLNQNTLLHIQETEDGRKRKYEKTFSYKFKKFSKNHGSGILSILAAIIVLPIIGIGYLLVMGIGSYIGMIIMLVVYFGILAYVIGLGIMYLLGKLFKFEHTFDIVYNIACVAIGGLVIGLYYLITH